MASFSHTLYPTSCFHNITTTCQLQLPYGMIKLDDIIISIIRELMTYI